MIKKINSSKKIIKKINSGLKTPSKIQSENKKIEDSEKKTKPDYYKRLEKANEINSIFYEDEVLEYEKNKKIVLKIKNVKLLSNNDLLRIKFDKLNKYKALLKSRTSGLLQRKKLCDRDNIFFKNKVITEIIIEKNGQFFDSDALNNICKFFIDGLVNAGALEDDNNNYNGLTMSYQIKSKTKIDSVYIIIKSIETEEEIISKFSEETKILINA